MKITVTVAGFLALSIAVGPDIVAHEGDEIVSPGTGLASGDGLAHPCGKVFVSRKAGSEPSGE